MQQNVKPFASVAQMQKLKKILPFDQYEAMKAVTDIESLPDLLHPKQPLEIEQTKSSRPLKPGFQFGIK